KACGSEGVVTWLQAVADDAPPFVTRRGRIEIVAIRIDGEGEERAEQVLELLLRAVQLRQDLRENRPVEGGPAGLVRLALRLRKAQYDEARDLVRDAVAEMAVVPFEDAV